MTEKQQAYLFGLKEYRFNIPGKHFGESFMEVFRDPTYIKEITDKNHFANGHETMKFFKTFLELMTKCCDECHGRGEVYLMDDVYGPCDCRPVEYWTWLVGKAEAQD